MTSTASSSLNGPATDSEVVVVEVNDSVPKPPVTTSSRSSMRERVCNELSENADKIEITVKILNKKQEESEKHLSNLLTNVLEVKRYISLFFNHAITNLLKKERLQDPEAIDTSTANELINFFLKEMDVSIRNLKDAMTTMKAVQFTNLRQLMRLAEIVREAEKELKILEKFEDDSGSSKWIDDLLRNTETKDVAIQTAESDTSKRKYTKNDGGCNDSNEVSVVFCKRTKNETDKRRDVPMEVKELASSERIKNQASTSKCCTSGEELKLQSNKVEKNTIFVRDTQTELAKTAIKKAEGILSAEDLTTYLEVVKYVQDPVQLAKVSFTYHIEKLYFQLLKLKFNLLLAKEASSDHHLAERLDKIISDFFSKIINKSV